MKKNILCITCLFFTVTCVSMQKRYSPEEELLCAIDRGDLPKVQRLIAEEVNIHYNDEEPLRRAARKGDIHLVEMLMDAGADSAVHNYEELIKAHLCGHALLLATLVGMPINERERPLIVSRKAQSKMDVFAKTFDPNETYIERALLCACIDNNLFAVQELIAKKANIKARYNLALKIAFQNNYPAMVSLLLKNGASLDGQTPEQFAERYAPRIKQGPFMSPLKRDSSAVDLEKKEALLRIMQEGLEMAQA